jgi:uncharacterized protein (DUF58 family)
VRRALLILAVAALAAAMTVGPALGKPSRPAAHRLTDTSVYRGAVSTLTLTAQGSSQVHLAQVAHEPPTAGHRPLTAPGSIRFGPAQGPA